MIRPSLVHRDVYFRDDSLSTLLQTSIFLSSLPAESTELSIRTRVIQSLPTVQPTQLKSVVHIAKSKLVPGVLDLFMSLTFTPRCAFVNFKDRATAELAAEAWANGLDVDGERVGVKWGRSKAGVKPTSSGPNEKAAATL
jgi:pre-mRNA-splicing factor RBM22/SLT11